MKPEQTRWTVVVDINTDIGLRTFLAQNGMKKGDLSKFVEMAVRNQLMAMMPKRG